MRGWNSTLLWKNRSLPPLAQAMWFFPRSGTKRGHLSSSTNFNLSSHPELQARGWGVVSNPKSRYIGLGWFKRIWGTSLFLVVKESKSQGGRPHANRGPSCRAPELGFTPQYLVHKVKPWSQGFIDSKPQDFCTLAIRKPQSPTRSCCSQIAMPPKPQDPYYFFLS